MSDWSWVFINSVLKQFNDGITIKQYLNISYQIIIEQKRIDERLVGIFVCCSHFAAIIVRQIKQKIVHYRKEIRSFIMVIFFQLLIQSV